MSNNEGIPQRARRSESMTGAEALIDLLVSPGQAPSCNSAAAVDDTDFNSRVDFQHVNICTLPSSCTLPDRLAEGSPLSPRRSKAVAALSGLAGLGDIPPEAMAILESVGSAPSSATSELKSKRSKVSPSSADGKKKTAGSTGKRKHGSGPAHKPGVNGTLNMGRWTTEEHNRFLKGLEIFKKDWKNIAAMVRTRTVVQVRFGFLHLMILFFLLFSVIFNWHRR